jgi:prophage tail gpP-like protein
MLKLAIDQSVYTGWIQARIERGLDVFASRFSLRYMDQWTADAAPWPIKAGAKCVLSWDSETLIDGYVDQATWSISGEQWTLAAAGRSRTGDLVDCSAINKTGHWSNRTALEIAKDLCDPYDIDVTAPSGAGDPFPRFTLQEGETVFDALDRMCKLRGLLPITTPAGDVKLFSVDALPFDPVIKLDVASAIEREYADDSVKRFSQYLVRATGVGSSEEAFTRAQALDTGVARFRPLVVVGDAPAGTKQAQVRAIWDANVRIGRGERLSYTFMSPVNLAGKTYAPGQRYNVQDDAFGVDTILIVQHATLEISEEAISTRVELVHPEAYAQFAFAGKAAASLLKKSKHAKKTTRGSL